jgi:hypothetical protein
MYVFNTPDIAFHRVKSWRRPLTSSRALSTRCVWCVIVRLCALPTHSHIAKCTASLRTLARTAKRQRRARAVEVASRSQRDKAGRQRTCVGVCAVCCVLCAVCCVLCAVLMRPWSFIVSTRDCAQYLGGASRRHTGFAFSQVRLLMLCVAACVRELNVA